jgi:hypothetical protein
MVSSKLDSILGIVREVFFFVEFSNTESKIKNSSNCICAKITSQLDRKRGQQTDKYDSHIKDFLLCEESLINQE